MPERQDFCQTGTGKQPLEPINGGPKLENYQRIYMWELREAACRTHQPHPTGLRNEICVVVTVEGEGVCALCGNAVGQAGLVFQRGSCASRIDKCDTHVAVT